MRTPVEALKELRDRLTYFCARLDGKYDPPWVAELIGIIDDSITETQIGNKAAMREALGEIIALCSKRDYPVHELCEVERIAEAALYEPPRNCDVGTAEEQTKRYHHFCSMNLNSENCCGNCPANGKGECELIWAQMPYEEGGAE